MREFEEIPLEGEIKQDNGNLASIIVDLVKEYTFLFDGHLGLTSRKINQEGEKDEIKANKHGFVCNDDLYSFYARIIDECISTIYTS